MKIKIFCAHCQAEQAQAVTTTATEIITQCPVCERELKWRLMPVSEFRVLIAQHAAANAGQVPLNEEGKSKAAVEFLDGLEGSGLLVDEGRETETIKPEDVGKMPDGI